MKRAQLVLKYTVGAMVIVALVVWAGVLIYGIIVDSGNAFRYSLKLVMVAGLLSWVFSFMRGEPQ